MWCQGWSPGLWTSCALGKFTNNGATSLVFVFFWGGRVVLERICGCCDHSFIHLFTQYIYTEYMLNIPYPKCWGPRNIFDFTAFLILFYFFWPTTLLTAFSNLKILTNSKVL